MTTEEWFEKATAYFNGSMTTEEVQLFEAETAASEELSQLMQLWKNTDEEAAIYVQDRQAADAFIATHQKLKKTFINDTGADEFSTDARQLNFSLWKWVAAAAVITGTIFMINLLIPSSKQNLQLSRQTKHADSAAHTARDTATAVTADNKPKEKSAVQTSEHSIQAARLYAEAFVPDDAPKNPNELLDDAFFYYASAQYKNAINAIDSAGSKAATRGNNAFTPLTNFYAQYYKGLSMMLLNNTAGAIPVLQQAALQSPEAALKAKAQWYLALAYLKQEKIADAVSTLQLLINNAEAGIYKSKAEKLLAALNK
jgi:tetratricopeptide (TPR) repeat protein